MLATVPETRSLTASLFGNNLWIADEQNSPQQNLLEVGSFTLNGISYVRIYDAAAPFAAAPCTDPPSFTADNEHSLFIPHTLITGTLQIQGGGGEDTLTIDLDKGNPIPAGGIFFHGDLPTAGAGDLLVIHGGIQGTVTYNYWNASDGNIELSNYGTITYTGLEPITNSGTATDVIFNLPPTANDVVLEDDGSSGNGLSRLSGGTFETTDFANPSGSVTINRGSAGDTLTTATLPDLTSSLRFGAAAAPFQNLTFSSPISLAVHQSLAGFASNVISLPNSTSDITVSGTGSISLSTASNMRLVSGASLTTVDGNLTLEANRQASATAGAFIGIDLADAVVQSLGAGNVTVSGRGGMLTAAPGLIGVAVQGAAARIKSNDGDVYVTGDGGGTGASFFGYGVQVAGGAQIETIGAGSVTVAGMGGDGGGADYGVVVTGADSRVGTANGSVSVTGTGGNAGSSNHGVLVNHSARIEAGGSFSTTVAGYSGGNGDSNIGVLVAGGVITSGGGAVNVTGTGGVGTNLNDGVAVSSAGRIAAAGTGLVTVIGNAAGNNRGVKIEYASKIETSGNVVIDATSLAMTGGSTIKTLGAGSVTVGADQIAIDNTAIINVGANSVTLKPNSAGKVMNLGAADSATALGLTDAELDRVTAGTLVIGASNLGGLVVSEPIARPSATNIVLRPGNSTTLLSGSISTNGGTLVIDNPGFPLRPLTNGTDAHVANLSFSGGSKLQFEIAGPTADAQYSQLGMLGEVNLTGVEFVATGTYTPTPTDSFVIVKHWSTFSTIGTFNGLAEGSILTVNGTPMRITYLGGVFGHDVVLLPHNRPPTITSNGGGATASITVFNGATAVTTVTATDVDLPANQLTYSVTGADGALFTVHPTSGALQFVAPADAASPTDAGRNNVYDVIVQVSDGVGGIDSQSLAITVDNLIPLTGHRDLVYDHVRQQLLITTTAGTLLRFDEATRTMLPALTVGYSLNGGDITADGRYFYVTDTIRLPTPRLHRVDLNTGSVKDLPYPRSATTIEGGGWDLSIAGNNIALFTASINGSCSSCVPIRQVTLANDVISETSHAVVVADTHINRSADRSSLFIQEGEWGSSNPAYIYSSTQGFLPGIAPEESRPRVMSAVSPNGQLYAMESYWSQTANVFDANFRAVEQLANVTGGLIFHPTQDLLLVVDVTADQMVAFDTDTWQERYRLRIGEDVDDSTPLGPGVMAFSADGSRLYLSTEAGVRILSVPPASGVASQIALSNYGTYVAPGVPVQLTATIQDRAGNVVPNFTGTVHFTSNDPAATLPADYTFTAQDNGSHSFTFTLPTAGNRTVTMSVVGNEGVSGTTTTINVHSATSTLLPITGGHDLVIDSLRNLLYVTTESGKVQRYDIATDSLLAPWTVGTKLSGADLTLDQGVMYVQEARVNLTEGMIYKVDLASGGVKKLKYDLDEDDGGGVDIGIAADGSVFASFSLSTITPFSLRKIDPSTDAITKVSGFAGLSAYILRSEDRSKLLFRDGGLNEYFFTYTSGGAFSPIKDPNISYGLQTSAVSPDGSLIAMELDRHVVVLDSTFQAVRQFSNVGGGIFFHPTQPILFVVDDTANKIIAYDTRTWEERYRINSGSVGTSTPLGEGMMAVSPDGSKLFLIKSTGVQAYALPAANGLPGNIALSNFSNYLAAADSSSLTVAIRDPSGEIDTDYTGTIQFSSTDPSAVLPANYTFTLADQGKHTFSFSLPTAGTHTVTVKDAAVPALIKATSNIQAHANFSTLLPIPGAHDLIFDASRNAMYIVMGSGQIQRYSLTSDSLLAPWNISTSLNAGDISVNNSTLYVQEGVRNALNGVIHKIDLNMGTDLPVQYVLNSGETAGWDFTIAGNGKGFATHTIDGSGGTLKIRQIDTNNNDALSLAPIGNIDEYAAVGRNANRSTLVLMEGSGSDAFSYSSATGTFSPKVNIGNNMDRTFLAINDAGTLFAMSHFSQLQIRNAALATVATIATVRGGVAFQPGTNRLFVADRVSNQIRVYDGDNGWAQLSALAIGEVLGSSSVVDPFDIGTLAFNGDGTKLFLITALGVRVYSTLEVTPPTVGGLPGNQVVLEDTSTGALPFTVGDNLTPVADLVLSATSSNTTLIPVANLQFGGSGANRTIAVSPATNLSGGPVTITVSVTDRSNNLSQFSFTVTVTSVNDPPTFVKGTDPSAPFNGPAQSITGWATGITSGATNEAQTVSFTVTGNTNSSLFAVPPALSPTGILTYTPAAGVSGTATITIVAQDSAGAVSAPQSFVVTIGTDSLLRVTSFLATPTGYIVEFNRDIDVSTLNLVDTQGGSWGPADILFLQGSVPVRGTAVIDPGLRKLTFIATDGLLSAGSYSLRLRSAVDGFRDSSAVLLDGDNNGLAGGDYVKSLVVAAPVGVVVGLPNIVRGPGQDVNIPVTASTGIPISFSDGGGLTRASFSLRYDAELLNVTTASVAPGLPLGATVSIAFPQPGLATIEFRSPEPLRAGTTRFVEVQASVPTTSIYRQKYSIDIFDINLGGVANGVDDDAVQVVAYFGDITGNGTYSAQDASIVAQFAVGIINGLEAYRFLDPLLIGDITGNGSFSSLDVSRLLQAAVGLPVEEIPAQFPVHTILQGGPDPKVSIPQNLVASPGESLLIPVEIESIVNLTGNGLTSADMVIYYDPEVIEITEATLGSLVAQRGWLISSRIHPLAGRIDLSLAGRSPLEGTFRGQLVQLHTKAKSTARPGEVAINLAATSRMRSTQLNEGYLTLIPAPTDAANDSIDGRVTIVASEGSEVRSENIARLISEQLLITGSSGDDRILVASLSDGRLRVRAGNQHLGDFTASGVAIDVRGGNDFVYVAHSAIPAMIAAQIDDRDFLFGSANLTVIGSGSATSQLQPSANQNHLQDEALLQW